MYSFKPIFLIILSFLLVFGAVSLYIQPVIYDYTLQSEQVVENWIHQSPKSRSFVPFLVHHSERTYYVSHPPLSYYFLYLFCQLIPNTYWAIYGLNSLLILISSFFVYAMISLISLKKPGQEYAPFGFLGMMLFIVSIPVLNFSTFNYHPDIFALPLFIALTYTFLKMQIKNRYRSPKYLFFFSLLTFMITYSSWMGVMFSLTIFLFGLFHLRRGYKMIHVVLLSLFITFGTLLLIYFQYAKVTGWTHLAFLFKNMFVNESLFYGSYFETIWSIVKNQFKFLSVLYIAFVYLVFKALHQKHNRFVFTKNGYRFLGITGLPIFFVNFILFRYCQNSYMVLYSLFPLVVTVTIWFEKTYKSNIYDVTLKKNIGTILLSSLFLLFIYRYFI
jgi:hypothetical protein